MELPEGVTVVGRGPSPFAGFETVELSVDICKVFEGVREAFKQVGRAAQRAGKVLRQFAELMRRAANDEVRVAGLEARYYVRGGLACALGLDNIDTLVRDLLTSPGTVEPDEVLLMTMLTRENRARLAASALRGYVEHTDAPANLLPWHRYMSGTRVVVR